MTDTALQVLKSKINHFTEIKGAISMSIIVSMMLSLFLTLTGPHLLWAKTSLKANKTAPETTAGVKDLESATADLQENIKDLRRNITSWRKIQGNPQIGQAEKKNWRQKAESYLQDCEAYDEVLKKVDTQKLPPSEVSNRFLAERRTFQRELQYLRETLQKP